MQQRVKPSPNRQLWQFHGGLHLPDHKQDSLQRPLATMPIPAKLVIPIQQHIGEPPELVVEIGDQVRKGQLLAKPADYVSAPVHASSSGTVVAIGEHPVPHPSGLSGLCITVETDGDDRWDDLPEPMTPFVDFSPAQLKERIRWAGIVGMGGATFPAGVKLNPGPDKPIDTLIVNAAECEPYITCDDMLMQQHPDGLLSGIQIVMHILGAKKCMIGIEENKPEAIAQLNDVIERKGLGQVEVVVIPTLYPSGGEKQLIRILTGQEVPSHGLPADIGIVCHNVATLFAIHEAIELGRPLISRIVTITGAGISAPQNLVVANGTLLSELVDFAGGYTPAADKLIMGGPMMGVTLGDDQVPATKGTNCLLVSTAAELPTSEPALPCIRCGKCAEVCPAKLLPQQLYWYARSRDFDKTQDYNLFDCIECGCCAHVCPSHIPLVQYYRFAKTEVWAKEEERRKSDIARRRHEFKEARLARLEAERKAKLRKKKESLEGKGKPGKAAASKDPKKAAIEAAMQRVAEKKKQLQEKGLVPANTDNLTPDQQAKIEAVNKRRKSSKP